MNELKNFFNTSLNETDPDLFASLDQELTRQRDGIELIASENIVSKAVLEAQGSVFTNKYAEGYPSKRYYGGCEFVDVAEQLAIDRVKALFDVKWANVQPHSGAQANQGVFLAFFSLVTRSLVCHLLRVVTSLMVQGQTFQANGSMLFNMACVKKTR